MDFLRNLRYALRKLRKSPGSSAIGVIAMALGIGLTASMFAIIDGVYLRGLPFEDSHRLVVLERNNLAQDVESMSVTLHDFIDWRQQQTSFEGLTGHTRGTFNIADDDNLPERYDGAWISANFLDQLRVEPVLGRGFRPTDEQPGAEPVLLISYNVWQARYGGEDVTGMRVRLNSEPATIVGVLPEGFEFPIHQEMWMPLVLDTEGTERGEGRQVQVFGRLADGVTVDQAQTEISLIADRLEQQYPVANEGIGATVQPYMDEMIGEQTVILLGAMMVSVVLVLLIACFNVANLLIGRASLRSRETAIRTALGSGRLQAIGEVLWEATVIAGAGAVLGIGIAAVATRAFQGAIMQIDPGFWVNVYLSPRTLLVVVGATALAALVSGLVPALQAARPNITEALQDTTRGSTSYRLGWISRALVVAQVAVSGALLIGAGLNVRSIVAANTYDLAFDTENLLIGRLGLFEGTYPEDQDRVTFFEQLQRRLGDRAEVASAAIGTVVPTDTSIGAGGGWYERPGETYDQPWQMPWARRVSVSPGYFETLGVPILTGRDFHASDRAEAPPVAIVNQSFAEREWGDDNPVGKTVDLWLGEDAEAEDPNAGVMEVVGMVPDLRMAEFDNADDQHGVYMPIAQQPTRFAWAIVRTKSAPLPFSEDLRRVVLAMDPDLPLYFLQSMDQVLERTMFMPNLLGTMFGIFGAAALLLGCVGLFGLMSFAVNQRLQEMGVRMALGASARDVVAMVLGQGVKQTAIGLAISLLLGFGLASVLSSVLFAVGAFDLVTYLVVPMTLLLVAVLSCLVPALRAASVDPMDALRYE